MCFLGDILLNFQEMELIALIISGQGIYNYYII